MNFIYNTIKKYKVVFLRKKKGVLSTFKKYCLYYEKKISLFDDYDQTIEINMIFINLSNFVMNIILFISKLYLKIFK